MEWRFATDFAIHLTMWCQYLMLLIKKWIYFLCGIMLNRVEWKLLLWRVTWHSRLCLQIYWYLRYLKLMEFQIDSWRLYHLIFEVIKNILLRFVIITSLMTKSSLINCPHSFHEIFIMYVQVIEKELNMILICLLEKV